MRLKLNKIQTDKGTQIREKINHTVVSDYAQSIMEGAIFPPVDVFFDGLDYYLVDGFHRYFAHKQVVSPDIEVNIHNGTLREAIDFARKANPDHGLQRTQGDKRNAVMITLMDDVWNKASDRQIAKDLHVSHTLVQNVRKSLEIERPSVKEVVRGDKKFEMDVSKIQKKKEEELEVDTEFDEAHELAVTNKVLTEEIDLLNDKLAIASLQGSEEDKTRAKETIDELRAKIKTLEIENDSLKSSLQTYMAKNAEMIKQLNYYKRRIEKMEKASA